MAYLEILIGQSTYNFIYKLECHWTLECFILFYFYWCIYYNYNYTFVYKFQLKKKWQTYHNNNSTILRYFFFSLVSIFYSLILSFKNKLCIWKYHFILFTSALFIHMYLFRNVDPDIFNVRGKRFELCKYNQFKWISRFVCVNLECDRAQVQFGVMCVTTMCIYYLLWQLAMHQNHHYSENWQK